MTITHKIKMDLGRKNIEPPVNVVQGDTNTRAVEISLFDNNVAWPVPSGVSALVRYRKPDGTGGVYDTLPDGSRACSVSGNTITAILAPQVLTVAGCVEAQVEMVQGSLILGTFTIKVLVERDPSAGAAESENYFAVKNFLPQTTGAKVGQYLEIAEVDKQGMVTKLKPVAAPTGSSDGYELTDADKNEIVSDVLTALPTWTGGSY